MSCAGTPMFETLVSSRIRRALFEHILAHPSNRFYLRGLAKSLGLSVSPLRRELKRLEQAGMLRVVQEGNMLFYTVNTEAATFLQLQRASLPVAFDALVLGAMSAYPVTNVAAGGQAGQQTKAPSPSAQASDAVASEACLPSTDGDRPAGSSVPSQTERQTSLAARSSLLERSILASSPPGSLWQAPLPTGALVGAAGVGAVLLIIVASLLYLRLTSRELLSEASRALAIRKAEMVIAPREASSRVMRGNRWQISPGGFGGFSSGAGTGTR